MNVLDKEISELEDVVALEETQSTIVEFVQDTVQSCLDGLMNGKYLDIQTESVDASEDMQQFTLPGVWERSFDKEQVVKKAVKGNWRGSYNKGDRYNLVRVAQGEMWRIKRSKNPYFFTSMSECSTIVGVNDDEIAVSHISYSELESTILTVRWMLENNLKTIFAVTNEGEKNPCVAKNQARKKDYESLGIPEENILPFTHHFENGVHHNITQTVVTNDRMYVYSFDSGARETNKDGIELKEPRIVDF